LQSEAGVDCYIGSYSVGALDYADDSVLIAPNQTALDKVFVICESYAADFCIFFDSLRTKCRILSPKERRNECAHVENLEFPVDDILSSFVKSFSHLRHLIKSDMIDDDDIVKRRKRFHRRSKHLVFSSYTLTLGINYSSLLVQVTTVASCGT
jgi:hypothetical protein